MNSKVNFVRLSGGLKADSIVITDVHSSSSNALLPRLLHPLHFLAFTFLKTYITNCKIEFSKMAIFRQFLNWIFPRGNCVDFISNESLIFQTSFTKCHFDLAWHENRFRFHFKTCWLFSIFHFLEKIMGGMNKIWKKNCKKVKAFDCEKAENSWVFFDKNLEIQFQVDWKPFSTSVIESLRLGFCKICRKTLR